MVVAAPITGPEGPAYYHAVPMGRQRRASTSRPIGTANAKIAQTARELDATGRAGYTGAVARMLIQRVAGEEEVWARRNGIQVSRR